MVLIGFQTKNYQQALMEQRVYAYYGNGNSAAVSHYLKTGDTTGMKWKEKRNIVLTVENEYSITHIVYEKQNTDLSIETLSIDRPVNTQEYANFIKNSVPFLNPKSPK
jgi:hypothetical protein